MTDGWEERFAGEDLISGQAQLTYTTYSTFSPFSAVEFKEALFEKIKAAVENLIHVALILEFWLVLCQGFLIRAITKVPN